MATPRPSKEAGEGREGRYSAFKIQPIEFIEANDLPFHEGSVIKYLLRSMGNPSISDLKKARWYVDRLIQLAGGN